MAPLTATMASARPSARCLRARLPRMYAIHGSTIGQAAPALGRRQRVMAAAEQPGHNVGDAGSWMSVPQ